MPEPGVAGEVRGAVAALVGTVLSGLGGLVARDGWKAFKRSRAERKRREELLDIVADVARWQLDESRDRERLTATGRLRPVTAEEIGEARGKYSERRNELMTRLWEAQGHVERRGKPPEKQDMFREDDTE